LSLALTDAFSGGAGYFKTAPFLMQLMHPWRSERSPPAEDVPAKSKISHRPSAFANQDLGCQSDHSPEKGSFRGVIDERFATLFK